MDTSHNGNHRSEFLKRNRNYRDQMYFPQEHLHPVVTDDPAVILQAKDLAELIRQLPHGYQTIFNLHAIEGYSHVEIGKCWALQMVHRGRNMPGQELY